MVDGFVRYRICVQYVGTKFSGWLSNPNKGDVVTYLSKAIEKFVGKGNFSGLRGSSRTDKGVHALRNCFQVDIGRRNRQSNEPHTPFDPEVVQRAINFHLNSNNIAITDVVLASNTFDARRQAIGRSYVYRICHGHATNSPQSLNVFERERVWSVESYLNVDRMRQACDILKGTHDFSAFRNTGCQAATPIKTISHLSIEEESTLPYYYTSSPYGFSNGTAASGEDYSNIELSGNKGKEGKTEGGDTSGRNGLILIRVTANSFLYKMVRNMVSVLVEVGKGKSSIDDVKNLLLSRDRGMYPPAPPYGLYLVDVHYSFDTPHTLIAGT